MSKRLATFMVILAVVAAAPAAAKGGRTVEKAYNKAEVGPSGSTGFFGSVVFETRRSDRFVSLEVLDDTGQAVAFDIQQGEAGAVEVDGCGRTEAPVRIRGGRDVTVALLIHADLASDCPGSFPTTGVVRATFSR